MFHVYNGLPESPLSRGYSTRHEKRFKISMNQMVLVFKTRMEQKPVFLHRILTKQFNYRTRAASSGSVVFNHSISGDVAKTAFISRSTKEWNNLPPQIKQAGNLMTFNRTLRIWIKQHVT